MVKTDALNPKKAKIHYELLTPQDEVVTYGSQEIELDMRREDTLRLDVYKRQAADRIRRKRVQARSKL